MQRAGVALPPPSVGFALEWPHHIRSDPASVESSRLRDNDFGVDDTEVHQYLESLLSVIFETSILRRLKQLQRIRHGLLLGHRLALLPCGGKGVCFYTCPYARQISVVIHEQRRLPYRDLMDVHQLIGGSQ